MGNDRTEDLVGRIVEDEARRTAKTPPRRSGPPLVLPVLALLALAVGGWLFLRRGPEQPAPTASEQVEGARRHMLEARDVVVAFTNRTGRLPESLDEAGIGDWALEYEKTGAHQFSLSMVILGTRATLRSIDDAGRFVRDGTNTPALIPALEAADESGGIR